MAAERFNPEQPGAPWHIPPHEAGGSPGVPKKGESESGKKSRKRKKRRQGGDEAAGTAEAAQAPDKSKEQPLFAGGGMIWERSKSDKDKPAALLGSKAFEAAEKSAGKAEPSAPVEAEATGEPQAPVKPETTSEPEASKPVTEKAEPSARIVAGNGGGESESGKRPEPEARQPAEKPAAGSDHPEQEAVTERPQESADAPVDEQQPPVERRAELPPDTEEPPVPPPLPPDPMSYSRRFWEEPPATSAAGQVGNREAIPPLYEYEQMGGHSAEPAGTAERRTAVEPPAPVPAAKRYESDTPPGYQRTPEDVSRAAWTGLIAGWWLGRRGKRKAMERARKAGLETGRGEAKSAERYSAPRLEAEPIHTYQTEKTPRRTVQPLSVETRASAATASPAAERVAAPAAAVVAVLERAVPRPEVSEVPLAARRAAAKAAEAVVTKGKPEVAIGARSERDLGRREVMKVAKDIKVDGVSLKEIYKANRIDEEGLRAVVDTYLRGGDIRQRLSKEVVAKEQSYERDPSLRHMHRHEHGERRLTGQTGEKVGKVLSHAKEIAIEQGGRLAVSTQKTAHRASQAVASGAKQAQHDLIDGSNTSDWISITAVVVVWSLILILWLG